MPKTITTTVYTFDELDEAAKEKARDWYREGQYDEFQFEFAHMCEDAKQIGLEIDTLDDRGVNRGKLLKSAPEVIASILKEHGETCETYKTAQRFAALIKEAEDTPAETDEAHDAFLERMEELEKDFLDMLLEDYRVMYEQACEYRASDEAIDETILANEYTFTPTGEREG